jgi:hypothetical protein
MSTWSTVYVLPTAWFQSEDALLPVRAEQIVERCQLHTVLLLLLSASELAWENLFIAYRWLDRTVPPRT